MTIESDFKIAIFDHRAGPQQRRLWAAEHAELRRKGKKRRLLEAPSASFCVIQRAIRLRFSVLRSLASLRCRFLSVPVAYCRLLSLIVGSRKGFGTVPLSCLSSRVCFNSVLNSHPTQFGSLQLRSTHFQLA
jgi:hypothetical protein